MKARITFHVDLSDYSGVHETQEAAALISKYLIAAARASHLRALHEVRSSNGPATEEKAMAMAEQLMKIKLTLMCEANMDVALLPNDGDDEVSNVLAFERAGRPADIN